MWLNDGICETKRKGKCNEKLTKRYYRTFDNNLSYYLMHNEYTLLLKMLYHQRISSVYIASSDLKMLWIHVFLSSSLPSVFVLWSRAPIYNTSAVFIRYIILYIWFISYWEAILYFSTEWYIFVYITIHVYEYGGCMNECVFVDV